MLSKAIGYAAKLLDRPLPTINLPVKLGATIANILEFFYKQLPLPGAPIITRYLAAELSNHFHFSTEKASRLLGFKPRTPFEIGLRISVEDYQKQYLGG